MELSEEIKNYFKEMGRQGGKKGSANLTPEQRKERARKAIQARWKGHKRKSK